MSKLTEVQAKQLERLKKALAGHKDRPTEASKALVAKHYEGALRLTLSPEDLTKEEIPVLQSALE